MPGKWPCPRTLPSPAVTKGHTRAGTGLGSRASHPQHCHGSHKCRVTNEDPVRERGSTSLQIVKSASGKRNRETRWRMTQRVVREGLIEEGMFELKPSEKSKN